MVWSDSSAQGSVATTQGRANVAIRTVLGAALAHERILLLGPTGVDKGVAASRLTKYLSDNFGQRVRFIDFEAEYLSRALKETSIRSFNAYLKADGPTQAQAWNAAWKEAAKQFGSGITVLALHATYVSNVVGLRCPVNVPDICKDFSPTLIVTLIDDVQNMWCRTEARAQGRDDRGRPTLEQLLSSRRAELLLGDILVTHLGASRVRHIAVASSNALCALANLVIFDAKITYLSFPISAPREMATKGDTSFIGLINQFHRLALTVMTHNRQRAFITPLAIDELPMVLAWEKEPKSPLKYRSARDRWSQSDMWGDLEACIVPALQSEFELPAELIRDAAGIVRTDVGWRDRRLVLQSASLGICCPKDPHQDRITRGVKTEIDSATPAYIPCFYWQKPEWDPHNFLESQFPRAGSMGMGDTELLVKQVESLEALVNAEP